MRSADDSSGATLVEEVAPFGISDRGHPLYCVKCGVVHRRSIAEIDRELESARIARRKSPRERSEA